jgi:hypothetical protein
MLARKEDEMILWSVEKIKQLSTLRVTAWAGAKFLLGTGIGLLLATYLQPHMSVSFWLVAGWALIVVAAVMGLSTIYPIFKKQE